MKKGLRYILGLCGINLVIFVHEFGHYVAALWYKVPAPVFSIGFGPKVFGITIGKTLFQLALLPLGGYVHISEKVLSAQPFAHQAVIILAGIVFNLIFGIGILWITRHAPGIEALKTLASTQRSGFIGPFGIMQIISDSLLLGATVFWRIIGVLSINIGIFNLLPIPFFDGGQLVVYAIRAMNVDISEAALNWGYMIFLALLIFFLVYVTFRDVRRG